LLATNDTYRRVLASASPPTGGDIAAAVVPEVGP
jgi:hypothetical protein